MTRFQIQENRCLLKLSKDELEYLDNDSCDKAISESCLILDNLIENGIGEKDDKYLTFGIDTLYGELSESPSFHDLTFLRIPLPSKYKLFIKNLGNLSSDTFLFEYEYYTFFPLGEKVFASEVDGFFEEKGQSQFIPTRSQWEVIQLIKEHSRKEKTFDKNVEFLAKIKQVDRNNEIFFSSYLENENAIFPSLLKINIHDDGSFVPAIDATCNQKFQEAFRVYPTIKTNYSTQEEDSNRRVRVVVDDRFVDPLKRIKEVNSSRDSSKIIQIINSPNEYFDLDLVDVSDFYSDRVVEIGLYKPKSSKFISAYKSEWLPGITLDYSVNGSDQLVVESKEQLSELNSIIDEAIAENRAVVLFKEKTLPIETAEDLAAFAEKQFQSKVPIEEYDGEKISQKKVLIIRENEENLDYDLSTNDIPAQLPVQNIQHLLFPINNLNDAISLKSHQVEGVAWLQILYKEKYEGCLLADDMGLGKTLQVLYFIEWLGRIHEDEDECQKPILIVAPNSLLENWENEYNKFFFNHSYSIHKLIPPLPFGKNQIDKELIFFMQRRKIFLMTYETLRLHQLSICAVDFRLVVLDEAQRIKTPGRIVTNAAKSLKSKFKIAISGTPVENSLIDLWCITDFYCPGLLGSAKSFSKKYVHSFNEKTGDDLRRAIGPYLKRRLKKDAAKDLPLKLKSNNESDKEYFKSVNIVREMPDVQYACYKQAISQKNSSTSKNDMLSYINCIKGISDHPYLDLEDFLLKDADELINSSSKLQSTIELLDSIKRKGEKVLIFAERRNIQQMLQKVIIEKFGLTPSIVNGDTPSITSRSNNNLSRQSIINRFSDKMGFNVLILSPIAAGIGLNIVAANHVIHYSRHWNPAKEEQATDRAYRIGQNKNVYVYYPMAVSSEFDSFDVVLDELLNRKMSLAAHTLFPTEQAEVTISEIYSQL